MTKCIDCRHWEPEEKTWDEWKEKGCWGLCKCIEDDTWSKPYNELSYTASDADYSELVTNRDFGCVLFKGKDNV